MNEARRDAIKDAAKHIADAAEMIRIQRDLIESVADDEREALDAMPEGLRNGDRGAAMESGLGLLEEAIDAIDAIDFASIAEMLSDAIDRTVPAGPEATLDEETLLARRFDRLPAWAKEEIERLKAAKEAVEAKAAEIYPEPTSEDDFKITDICSPHYDKALPFDSIEVRDIEITIEKGRSGVRLRGRNGCLVVRANSSNTLYITSDRNW